MRERSTPGTGLNQDLSSRLERLEQKVPRNCGLEGVGGRPNECVNNPWRSPDNHNQIYCMHCPTDHSMPYRAEVNAEARMLYSLLFDRNTEKDIPPDVISLYFPFPNPEAIEEFKRKRVKEREYQDPTPLKNFVLAIAVLPDIYREAFVKRALGIDQKQKLDLSRLNNVIQDFRTINPPLDDLMIDSRQEIKS